MGQNIREEINAFQIETFQFLHILYIGALGMGVFFLPSFISFPPFFPSVSRPICSFVHFTALEYGFNGKVPDMRDCFWSVIIHKRNTRHDVMNLSRKQRRILKLKNSCLHTQLLQNIYSAMYIQKLPLAFLLLLLLKEFLTSPGLNTTKTKAFLYTVKSPEVILI